MKPNETKMYQGGGYLTYRPSALIPAQPEQVQSQPEHGAAQDKEDQALSPELIKDLIGKGLTNDVMQYSQMVNSAYFQYARMSDLAKNTYKGRQLRMVMKGDIGQLNALVRGKEDLDKSLERAHTNGSADEYAVTPHGMVVKDNSDGKVKTVSFQEFAQDNNSQSKKYEALTNSDLANEREYSDQLVGNSGVANIIGYGSGMSKVKEEVMKYLDKLGSSTRSDITGGYGDNSEVDDIKTLSAAAANGLFKTKEGETHMTNLPQIRVAMANMWNTLSDPSKATLRARAASLVSDPSQVEQKATELAAELLDPAVTTNDKVIHDVTAKRGFGTGVGKSGDKTTDMGVIQLAWHGKNDNNPVNLTVPTSDGKDAVKFATTGSELPPSLYTNDKNERTTLQQNGRINEIGYTDQAFTANGDPVNKEHTVITGGARTVILPVTMGDKGAFQIDTAGAQRYLKEQQEFKSLPSSQQTQLKDSELMSKYNIDPNSLRHLIMADTVSFADNWFDHSDPRFYKEVKDQDLKDSVGEAIKATTGKDINGFFLHHNAYEHPIFIPMKSEADARTADGNKMTMPADAGSVLNTVSDPQGADVTTGQGYSTGTDPSSTSYTSNYWTQPTK